jgi:hypothetical protein
LEQGVIRKIFGPNRDEISGQFRIPRSEELRSLYKKASEVQEEKVAHSESKKQEYPVIARWNWYDVLSE